MTIGQPAAVSPMDVKACCADFYASDWARMLLGDSFHPGGLAMTRRLARLLSVQADDRVLDVACGNGASAIEMARTFGCQVVGVDLSEKNVRTASAAALEAGLEDHLSFRVGDAERLPLDDGSFDAVICECALCTFPNKAVAAREFERVLAPDGRVGISDVSRSGDLPRELDTLLARVACLADARPEHEYRRLLEDAGLRLIANERHDEVLRSMVDNIQGRLFGAELIVKLGKVALPGADFEQARATARAAVAAVRDGRLGYLLIAAHKGAR